MQSTTLLYDNRVDVLNVVHGNDLQRGMVTEWNIQGTQEWLPNEIYRASKVLSILL